MPSSVYLALVTLSSLLFAACARDRGPVAGARPGLTARAWGTVAFWDRGSGATPRAEAEGKSPGIRMEMEVSPAEVDLNFTRQMEVTVRLVNAGRKAQRLVFPSSQRVEILLKDQFGKVLVRWSDDLAIERGTSYLHLNPKERAQYVANLSTRDMVAGKTFFIEAYAPAYPKLRAEKSVVPK